MKFMTKTVWRNVSIPNNLVEEIEEKKPAYMSVAEFIRLSVRFYIDHYLFMDKPQTEVQIVE